MNQRGRRLPAAAAAFVLIAIALLAVRPAPTPGPFLRDFEAYWSAGATWNARADPYGRAIWNVERSVPGVDAAHDEVLPFVGPPAALPLWGAIARLPYAVAAKLWAAALVLAILALAAVAVLGSAAGAASWLSFAAAVAFTVAFGPVTSDFALGQVALMAFLAASVVALLPQRVLAAGIAAFAAFLQPNVALGLASQLGRNRTTLALALAGVATYVAAALASGWNWPLAYSDRLRPHEAVERFSAIQITPAAIAHGAGATPAIASTVALIAAAAAIVAAVGMWRHVAGFARFAAFAPLAPFVASFFHEHDMVVAYVAAVWCAVCTRGSVRTLALIGTLLVAVDWLGLAQRPSGIVQSALLAFAAVCAFVALGERFDWRSTAVAVASLAAVFAFAAWLGAGHPAPVWPDTLGTFHASPSASISSVWHAEQRRSGLLTVNPTWSFLRALSLTGCALLPLAIYLTARTSKTHEG